jgi:hypothetical protein
MELVFKSRTVAGHMFRGVLGFGLLAAALNYAPQIGWWATFPALGALACFRGCPMCWTVGLVETIVHRRTAARCEDGSCAGAKEAKPLARAL